MIINGGIMIGANESRKGITFEYEGELHEVLDFQHVKPGKGPAFIRTKIRHVLNGSSKEVTINPLAAMRLGCWRSSKTSRGRSVE